MNSISYIYLKTHKAKDLDFTDYRASEYTYKRHYYYCVKVVRMCKYLQLPSSTDSKILAAR